jgi:hypothetical protein
VILLLPRKPQAVFGLGPEIGDAGCRWGWRLGVDLGRYRCLARDGAVLARLMSRNRQSGRMAERISMAIQIHYAPR